ncbi:DUF2845 domain-containing protein [uncultured Thiodictyon sp.]|uniref:DUF2845 domain-containing protein n=1 Tax=uncultured Thiodictyon sp. TaxID=1846217 RepID=UPI0025CCC97A|nr:DUF2845 domain-containing protein [uncultured Thiodictyon sp.]
MRHPAPLLLCTLIAGSAVLCTSNIVAAFYLKGANLRCGHDLVSEGDSTTELVNRCGPPTGIDKEEGKYRMERVSRDKPLNYYMDKDGVTRGHYAGREEFTKKITVVEPHEIWYYNFGPHQFVAYVTVRDGYITRIDEGARGQ